MARLAPGVQVTVTDESIAFEPAWTEWERTFLFLPKETITGREIIGFAWTRMLECRIHEYEEAIGYYLSPSKEGIEYARNKKEIFVRQLKGDEDAVVV